jgi:hypothetical protein
MKMQFENGPQDGVLFGPDQVGKRPDLAVRIALVANSWAVLEAAAAACLGVIMRAEAQGTIAILSKISTATARAQAIREIAKATLTEPQLGQLKAMLNKFENLAKRRNDVVHGMWGISGQHPAALIWAPTEIVSSSMLALIDHAMAGTTEDFIEKQKASFVLYDAEKFDALIAEIAKVTQELTSFTTQQHTAAIQYKISSAMQLAASIETN